MLPMRLLVLGGTRFVGRSIVEEGLRRGHRVTTLTRGLSGVAAPGADSIHADRTDAQALAQALGDGQWDAVIDTWSHAPVVVRESTRLLAPRTRHYGYVSSRSVYCWPIPVGLDESAPVVDGDPGSLDGSDYAAAKRGGELAVSESFAGRALLARAGLILGPYEDVGRLPWWLARIARGGTVLAPGPRDRKLQYIDARDLAAFMLDAAEEGLAGTYNTVSRPGHTTIGELLDICNDVTGNKAQLAWVAPEVIESAGVSAWTQLPIWVPPDGEMAGLHDGDVSAALSAGLRCRPVRETVTDTWRWMNRSGFTPARSERAPLGLDPGTEQQVLAAARALG